MAATEYLKSAKRQFQYYKKLGEQAIGQAADEDLFWRPNEDSNSIALIVQHLRGNMLSRWTHFLTEDGEKPWRERDAEFEEGLRSREELLAKWEEGWQCLFGALDSITDEDLGREIYIRSEAHSVLEAINRQLAHYPYHVGQIIFIVKSIKGEGWKSLSIPKNKSQEFNAVRFGEGKLPPAGGSKPQ